MTLSMGGYGLEGSDPTLQDKIAKLKQGRKSGKDRVNDFLTNELHVDPRELPFDKANADLRVKELAGSLNADRVVFTGNSLGLKDVAFKSSTLPDATCPNCNEVDGYWDSSEIPRWYCYRCDKEVDVDIPDTTIKTVDNNNPGGVDWHDLNRCWTAYVKTVRAIHTGTGKNGEDVEDERPSYSFTVTVDYYDPTVEAVPAPPVEPDISKHPTGTALRIQKASFHEGDMEVERHYVRVGGLFNDTDITYLDTMQPMTDVTGWIVVEVL